MLKIIRITCVKEYNWNKCSIVRPANVYGPNDNFGEWSMVVPSLIKKAMENDVLDVWGDGSPIRDLIYAEDVARGMSPMGDMKRLMDMSRAKSYGFEPQTSFEDGIIKTIEWYKENK